MFQKKKQQFLFVWTNQTNNWIVYSAFEAKRVYYLLLICNLNPSLWHIYNGAHYFCFCFIVELNNVTFRRHYCMWCANGNAIVLLWWQSQWYFKKRKHFFFNTNNDDLIHYAVGNVNNKKLNNQKIEIETKKKVSSMCYKKDFRRRNILTVFHIQRQ